jgi:hypothetical protein
MSMGMRQTPRSRDCSGSQTGRSGLPLKTGRWNSGQGGNGRRGSRQYVVGILLDEHLWCSFTVR